MANASPSGATPDAAKGASCSTSPPAARMTCVQGGSTAALHPPPSGERRRRGHRAPTRSPQARRSAESCRYQSGRREAPQSPGNLVRGRRTAESSPTSGRAATSTTRSSACGSTAAADASCSASDRNAAASASAGLGSGSLAIALPAAPDARAETMSGRLGWANVPATHSEWPASFAARAHPACARDRATVSDRRSRSRSRPQRA
jgi:hypothetical protein